MGGAEGVPPPWPLLAEALGVVECEALALGEAAPSEGLAAALGVAAAALGVAPLPTLPETLALALSDGRSDAVAGAEALC